MHSASLGCWDPRRPPVSFSFPLQALSSLASSGRVSSAGPKPVLPETRPAALGHPALGGMLWGRLAQMPLRQELTQAWRRRGSLLPGACHFSRQWPVAVPSSLSPVLDQLLWALPLLPRGLVRGPKLLGQTYRRLGWGLTLIVTKIMFLPATSPGSPDRRLQVPQFANCPAPPPQCPLSPLGPLMESWGQDQGRQPPSSPSVTPDAKPRPDPARDSQAKAPLVMRERQRDRGTERQRDRETGGQRDRGQRDRGTKGETEGQRERQRGRETERQRDRETGGQRERQRDRETEGKGDRQRERQRDKETERQRDRRTKGGDRGTEGEKDGEKDQPLGLPGRPRGEETSWRGHALEGSGSSWKEGQRSHLCVDPPPCPLVAGWCHSCTQGPWARLSETSALDELTLLCLSGRLPGGTVVCLWASPLCALACVPAAQATVKSRALSDKNSCAVCLLGSTASIWFLVSGFHGDASLLAGGPPCGEGRLP